MLVRRAATDQAIPAREADLGPAEPGLVEGLPGLLQQLRFNAGEHALKIHDSEQANDQNAPQKPAQGIASHAALVSLVPRDRRVIFLDCSLAR